MFGEIAAAVGGGVMNGILQDMTNRQNRAMASDQMDFQKEMSNTAHQRQVKDMMAAGLNPKLSGTGGSGASSPAGAMSTDVAPSNLHAGLYVLWSLTQTTRTSSS